MPDCVCRLYPVPRQDTPLWTEKREKKKSGKKSLRGDQKGEKGKEKIIDRDPVVIRSANIINALHQDFLYALKYSEYVYTLFETPVAVG